MFKAFHKEKSKKLLSLQFSQEVFNILAEASSDEESYIAECIIELLKCMEAFNAMAEKAIDCEILSPCLYDIEQIVYNWLRTYCAKTNTRGRNAMRTLMRALEENYCTLMALNPVLWIPPGTSHQTATEMHMLWDSITSGTGNIQIVSKDPSFISCIKFGIAKLLQTSYGRQMLTVLNTLQKEPNCTIFIGKNWKKVFKGQPGEKEWKPGSGVFAFVTVQHPEDRSFCCQENGPGKGTGSYVQIDITPEPFMVGMQDEPLYVPCFITLGHELGHAYNILLGQRCDIMILPQGYPVDQFEQSYWSNPEEFQNILHHENILRAQFGLPQRMYHIDYAGWQRSRRYVRILEDLKELLGQAGVDLTTLKNEATQAHFQGLINQLTDAFIEATTIEDYDKKLQALEQLKQDAEQAVKELHKALTEQASNSN